MEAMSTQADARTSGKQLQLERVARDVRVGELARAMGYRHPSSISQIEAQRLVTTDTARRYRTALATFATVTHTGRVA